MPLERVRLEMGHIRHARVCRHSAEVNSFSSEPMLCQMAAIERSLSLLTTVFSFANIISIGQGWD